MLMKSIMATSVMSALYISYTCASLAAHSGEMETHMAHFMNKTEDLGHAAASPQKSLREDSQLVAQLVARGKPAIR